MNMVKRRYNAIGGLPHIGNIATIPQPTQNTPYTSKTRYTTNRVTPQTAKPENRSSLFLLNYSDYFMLPILDQFYRINS